MDLMDLCKFHACVLVVLILNGFKFWADGARLPEVQIQTVVVLSPTRIQLSWRPVTKGNKRTKKKMKFQVKYKPIGEESHEQLSSKKPETTLADLLENTTYVISVRAVKAKKHGDWSKIVEATTTSKNSAITDIGLITVENITDIAASLSWSLTDNIVSKVQAYKVTWRNRQTDARQHTVVQGTSLQLDGLESSTSYTVSVYLFKSSGEKLKVDTVRFETTAPRRVPPGNVKVKWTTDTKMLLKWRHLRPSGLNATGYVVQYKRRGVIDLTCEIVVNVTKRMATLKGLRADSRYSVRLAAIFDGVIGPFTNWLKERTTPYSTSAAVNSNRHLRVEKIPLPVLAPGGQDILVTWRARNDVTHAQIELRRNDVQDPIIDHMLPRLRYLEGIYSVDKAVKDDLSTGDHVMILTEHTGSCTRYLHGHVYINETTECVSTGCRPQRNLSKIEDYSFEPYLRVLPLPDASHVVAWLPYPSNLTWMYQVILYQPGFIFMDHVASYYVTNKRSSIRLTSLDLDTQYHVYVLAWMDPLISPDKDVAVYRTLVIQSMGNDVNNTAYEFDFWALTSLDLLLKSRTTDTDHVKGIRSSEKNTTAGIVSSDATFSIDRLDGTPWSLLMTSSPGMKINVTSDMVARDNESAIDKLAMEISMRNPVGPYIANIPNITTQEDSVVNIRCLATGDPYPMVSWVVPEVNGSTTYTHNATMATIRTDWGYIRSRYIGATRPVNDSVYLATESSIKIYAVRLGQSGLYRCTAVNEAGTHEASVYLHVTASPPTKVQELVANSTTPYMLLIQWAAPDSVREFPGKRVIGYRLVLIDENGVTLREGNTTALAYAYIDLTPDTFFEVQVSAYNEDSEGEVVYVNTRTQKLPKLGPPINVTATTFNGSTVSVTWDPPAAARVDLLYIWNYLVYYIRVGGDNTVEIETDGNVTSVLMRNLEEEEMYEISVIAVSEDGQVSYADLLKASTHREAYMDETRPPPPPLNVYLRQESRNIIVTWLPPYPDENILVRVYEIDVYSNGTLRESMQVGHKESSVIIYEIDMGIYYRMSVKAVNNAGKSIGETGEIYVPEEYVSAYPVQNFTANALSSTKLSLSWELPTDGGFSHFGLSYIISGNEALVQPGGGHIPASVKHFVVRSLKPYTEYIFKITPYLKHKRGVTANLTVRTLTDKPTHPPSNISITMVNSTEAIDLGQIDLVDNCRSKNRTDVLSQQLFQATRAFAIRIKTTVSLTAAPPSVGSNGPIVTYKVAYRTRTTWRSNVHVDAADNGHIDSLLGGLSPSTLYEFRARALTVNGSGPWSDWIPVKTKAPDPVMPHVPRNLTTSTTSHSITLSWLPPDQNLEHIDGFLVGIGKYMPEVSRHALTKDQFSTTLTNLEPATLYIVSVRSFNEYAESVATFEVTTTLSESGAQL